MSAFTVEGTLARRVSAVTEVLAASALTLLATSPAWVFALVGGWQAAHTALWLGAATTMSVGPALVALLAVVRGVMVRRERSTHSLRAWAAAYVLGARAWRWWLVLAALVLLGGYQVALGGPTAGLAAVVLLALVLVVVGTAVASAVALTGRPDGVGVRRTLGATLRSPLAAIVWPMLTVLPLLGLVPLVGPALAFLAPAAWAVCVVVVNATFGFDERITTVRTGSER